MLDDSAVRAIRLWQWRPGKWKEIEIPVTFTLGPHGHYRGSSTGPTAQGTASYRKGNDASGVKAYDEAIRLQPTSVEACIMRGSAYQAEGQRDKALADFDEAIRLQPKSARAYCDRAILEEQLFRQSDKALADYNQAIHLAPEFQRAYYNRGIYFLERHDYDRAITDLLVVSSLMPSDVSTYAPRAYAYAKRGEHARAVADAAAATKLKRSQTPIITVTDLGLRATAYRILGQPELALHDLQEAVRTMPNDSTANGNLAWFLATCPREEVRNGTEAVSSARKACEVSHWEYSGCNDTLAAYAEAGDFVQAIRYEQQALNDSSLAPKEREEQENAWVSLNSEKHSAMNSNPTAPVGLVSIESDGITLQDEKAICCILLYCCRPTRREPIRAGS